MSKKIRAVALISGGLDSMLATKVIMEQGIEVEGLNFYTGFCHSGHTSAIRNQKQNKVKRNDALWVAEQLGIKLHIEDIVEEYKDILINPKYGYGQNINPCLDCKIFMLKKARQWMEEHDFDFIITGEVVGQRPKSQRKDTMPIVAQRSGAQDLLLRPLCALNLPETYPEQQGWVDRNKLYKFGGRGRKNQIALAEEFGFDEYAQPAGGCCVLTDESYAKKLEDLWAHRESKDYELDDIIMLKVGRHLRPQDHYKLIVARDEGENNFLEGYRKKYLHLRITSHTGPLVLIEGSPSDKDIEFAARIATRFSSGKKEPSVSVDVINKDTLQQTLNIKPLPTEDVLQEWYV